MGVLQVLHNYKVLEYPFGQTIKTFFTMQSNRKYRKWLEYVPVLIDAYFCLCMSSILELKPLDDSVTLTGNRNDET